MMLPENHAYLAGLRDTTATTLAEAILPGPLALLDEARELAARLWGN